MGAPSRILVVDDNDALRENLAEALQLEGYRVTVAARGADALALIEAEPPDAVVLDLVMPGMDGRELLARIRGDPRLAAIRVVVTSGLTAAAARADAMADAVLVKPFGIRDVLAALRSAGVPAP